MAEIKNSFLSSKMNKDLDDRLIPNGEYRDALNISVGKSENSDIGTVQNVLGNYEIEAAHEEGLTCIGFYMDNQNNRIYRFLTDYTDPSPTAINMAPEGTTHKITVYDFNSVTYTTLVEGIFLNFSTTNMMIGVNLLEGLLFFTDNRNQPRKINYFNAINNTGYYTTESQISVAKYAPVEAPILFREVNTTAEVVDGLDITVADATGITIGMTLISIGVSACQYATVLNVVDNVVTMYSLGIDGFGGIVEPGDALKFLISTMSDQADNPVWPGDPAYLESKYIRFSYRFKFDDNEHSIIAPFSQIAFIPKQKGYFINGDEQGAYRSTILKWMENNTNNVEVLIPLPDIGGNIRNSYKITGVDILYKESNSLAVKVLDTVSYLTIANSVGANTNIYAYQYQSQKPYKTLPEDQLTRVFDKVPVRALAQELSGNRVIYGNFYTTYTPPKYIDYKVGAQPKNQAFTNFIEYPNHTLKQNRNYQVGFILADKFGRQSSVILSTVDLATLEGQSVYGSSTIYSPYTSEDDPLFPGVRCWRGNALRVLVNNVITSDRNIPAGTPGLYAEQIGSGFAISNATIDNGKFTYSFSVDPSPIPNPDYPTTIPVIGDYLRGKYTDYVKITNVEWVWQPPQIPSTTNNPADFPQPPYGNYIISTEGAISDLYIYEDAPINVKYAYTLNQIGWYSYKVVVKQREQDYYNVYLPGMLDGYPVNQTSGTQVTYNNTGTPALENGINQTSFPVNETGKTSHIVLINDNINKVPRDLAEVGPDQKQYRSSVELYGRVENYPNKISLVSNPLAVSDLYATQIQYTIADDPYDLLDNVKIGDGIQCNIPSPPIGVTYPKWYANTVITSIEILNFRSQTVGSNPPGLTLIVETSQDIQTGDLIEYTVSSVLYNNEVVFYNPLTGEITLTTVTTVSIPDKTVLNITRPTIGVITFSPANPIGGEDTTYGDAWTSFTITTAENFQYYPLRKADIVNTIAYATDFNFLSNTVNNISGTAGLNFYQLQSNPLIGRVSTSKEIGTLAKDMVPTLGIYETAATESMLDLFWETSTTGLISDLNWAILTDFNGASGTTPTGFSFWEDQDWEGTNDDPADNSNTGLTNSPFITDNFFIVDNVNNEITPESCQLFSVFDLNPTTSGGPNNVTSKFELVTVTGGPAPSYRIKIKDYFEFTCDANTLSVFNFTLNVIYAGITTNIKFSGRLKNRPPQFLHEEPWYDRTIDRTFTDIVQVSATNGSYTADQLLLPKTNGLYWEIISGNEDLNFLINPSTGLLSLINPLAQIGVYPLEVKVTDASNFTTTPPSPLNNGLIDISSQSTIIPVVITIGENPVNSYLEYWDNYGGDLGNMPGYDPEFPEQLLVGYFGVYVGATPNANDPGVLPALPYNEPLSEAVLNVQVENGAIGPPFNGSPTGLTKGQLRVRVNLVGDDPIHSNPARAYMLIYHRPGPSGPWNLVKDDNYAGTLGPITWGDGFSGPYSPELITIRSASYPHECTGSYRVSDAGEYFFAIKVLTHNPGSVSVCVEDANYYYKRTGEAPYPDPYYTYSDPFIPRERFIVGMNVPISGEATGIPYDNFPPPSPGLTWEATTTVDTLDPLTPTTKFTINPTTPDAALASQIVSGVWLTKNSDNPNNTQVKVVGFDIATMTMTISPAFSTPVQPGDTITLRQLQPAQLSQRVRPMGNIFASSKDAVFVNQFYNQAGFNSLWNPPRANSIYTFMTFVHANPDLTLPLTQSSKKPNTDITAWNYAQIAIDGAIVPQVGAPTIYSTHLPNPLTSAFATNGGVLDNSLSRFWPSIYEVTSDSITVNGLIDPFINRITWSTECTTPTEDYYPDTTVDSSAWAPNDYYVINDLAPNTVYYILVYSYDATGYVNGYFHPIKVRTLEA